MILGYMLIGRLRQVAEQCVKQDTGAIVRAIGNAQCKAGPSPPGASLTGACVTATSFVVVGSTSITKDSHATKPRYLTLTITGLPS